MEVRDHGVGCPEFETWQDEQVRRALKGLNSTRPGDTSGALKRAHTRRPDGDDTPAARRGCVEGFRRPRAQLAPLCVNRVAQGVLLTDRDEGVQANVKGDPHEPDALPLDSAEKARREMQSSRWSGGRARSAGEGGLVLIAIPQRGLDIWGKGHLAELVQPVEDSLDLELPLQLGRLLLELVRAFVFGRSEHLGVAGAETVAVAKLVGDGPGKVLQGLIKRIVKDVKVKGYSTFKDIEELNGTSS